MNISKEFKRQMDIWFKEYPEIIYQWKENELKINHPKKSNKFITFQFDSKSIKIQSGPLEKIFNRKIFENIEEQVLKIRGFWINELLKKEDTEISKPKLKENQIAIMFCNRKFGQVLTTNKNIFTGWGNVYYIFDNKEEAKKFIEKELEDEHIEIHVYNSNYGYIEITR